MISIDSRTLSPGSIFVALTGPRFNGADFILDALKKGASTVVYSRGELSEERLLGFKEKYLGSIFIEVTDTHQYLKDEARKHLIQWKESRGGRVVAITGSNGKTTTKEMLAFMAKFILKDQILCTEKNLNNQIGVPLTIFNLTKQHSLLILEMGTNQLGEICILSDIGLPDMGIITNISETHLEFFKTIEGIFQEKRTLFDSIMERTERQGVFVLNSDDRLLRTLPNYKNVVRFGENCGDIRVQFGNKSVVVGTHCLQNHFITGKHNFINLACAFLMAEQLFPGKVAELTVAASGFHPHLNRSSWIKSGRGTHIFLDAYNANPASMEMAMKGFDEERCRRGVKCRDTLWIVGDMNELGELTESAHRELGSRLCKLKGENIIFIGKYQSFFRLGFSKQGLHCFETVDDFIAVLGKDYLNRFDLVFIKASRSLQLESLVDI